ncbi:MAG: hypothetical protein AAB428_00635 [Patescibacteria group bacterium]
MKKLLILFLILIIFLPPFGFGQAATYQKQLIQLSSTSRGSNLNISITGSNGSNLGTIAGSALGSLIGNQIGGGFGRTVSIFVGTFGGGFLGNIIGGSSGGSGGGGLTFGGMIGAAIPCTCSPGIGLIIGPPKGGIFLLSPSSKLHANMRPIPGSWVLGDYVPGGICLQAGTPCFPFPIVQGTIGKIGTS